MITDEEKKAIDYLQLCYDLSTITNESLSKLGIVLNLIEKQSIEIEDLKKEFARVREGRNWLIKHISAQIATPELFDKLVEENYTSNNKIKAKIEEYDDKGMTVNLANRSAGKTFQQAVHYEVKKVLQSLLKKEFPVTITKEELEKRWKE